MSRTKPGQPTIGWIHGPNRVNYSLTRGDFCDAARFGEGAVVRVALAGRGFGVVGGAGAAREEGDRARSLAISAGRLPRGGLPVGRPLPEPARTLGGMAAFASDLDSQSSRPRSHVIDPERAGARPRRVAAPAYPRGGGMGTGVLVLSMVQRTYHERSSDPGWRAGVSWEPSVSTTDRRSRRTARRGRGAA